MFTLHNNLGRMVLKLLSPVSRETEAHRGQVIHPSHRFDPRESDFRIRCYPVHVELSAMCLFKGASGLLCMCMTTGVCVCVCEGNRMGFKEDVAFEHLSDFMCFYV